MLLVTGPVDGNLGRENKHEPVSQLQWQVLSVSERTHQHIPVTGAEA